MRVGLAGLLALLCLAGCATLPDRAAPGVELTTVAYYPQEAFQCGPASLAALLNDAGIDVGPDALRPEVYIPARRGSLETELLAAARRHDRLPYVIDPDTDALRRQLDAGRPVLVLQNFGSRGSPVWHYAVVVGYEAGTRAWLLRSGAEPRQRLPARRFAATWDRADRFGFVLARPGEIPAGATLTRYLDAASGLDAAGRREAAALAYAAAATRWPEEPAAAFAYAGTQIASGDLAGAEDTYRRLLDGAPQYTAARNNLAVLLTRRGCLSAARRQLDAARAGDTGRFATELADTAAELDARSAGDAADATGCPKP
jgi:tetratricopeptide (TPR) repeat protein